MKDKIVVGFDVSPLYSGHSVRGIGFYTERLLTELEKNQGIEVKRLKSQAQLASADFDLLHIPYFNPFFWTWPLQKKTPWVITI
ncbi:MAG: hypothetical protein ABID04_02395, partial [Patescibacteria group bacterium]